MDCEQALEAISAALDGELSPPERTELEAHLSVCPPCRALAEDFRVLSAALDAAEAAPPPGLAEAVMGRTAGVVPVSAGRRKSVRRWVGLAAMLALVICAGGLGLWLRGTDRIMPLSNSTAGGAPPASDEWPDEQKDLVQAYYTTNGGAEPAEAEPSPDAGESGWKKDASIAGQDSLDGITPGAAPVPSSASGDPSSMPGEPAHYLFTNQRAIRVAWTDEPGLPSARILGSVEAAAEFAAEFADYSEDSLDEALKSYDAAWFATNSLLAVVVEEGSGSISHDIAAQGLRRDEVEIVRVTPENMTDDMAAWVILAEVDAMFEDGEELEVVFSD